MRSPTENAVRWGDSVALGVAGGARPEPRARLSVGRALWLGFASVVAASVVAGLVYAFDATPVLVVMMGIGAIIWMLVRPDLAVGLTTFLLYINLPAILTQRQHLPPIAAGSFVLLLGFPLLHWIVVRRARFVVDLTLGLMLVWLAVLLLASVNARDDDIAFGEVQVFVLEGVLIYWLFVNVIRDMRTLRRTMAAMLAAGSLVSALCAYQDASGSYTQEFGGLAIRDYQADETESDEATPGIHRTWDRAQGPVSEPNRFAQILTVLLPLGLFMVRTARSRMSRLSAIVACLVVLIGVLLTLSRGAMVALGLLLITLAFLRWISPWRVLAVMVAVALTIPLITPFFVNRLLSIGNTTHLMSGEASFEREGDGAIRGRATEMLAALYVFRDHPILGVGPGQFAPFYAEAYGSNPDIKFRDISKPRRAHSLYLEVAAEVGAVGLAVFLLIVGVILRALWRARQYWTGRDALRADLATALWLSVMSYLYTAVFLHLAYQRYYWLLLALVSAALHLMRRSDSVEKDGRRDLAIATSITT
jgi:hypothetical protein